MKNQIFILLISFLYSGLIDAQKETEVVSQNNEFVISLTEIDSTYGVFKVERYHDVSFYFGEITFTEDSVFFKEIDDTFFLSKPTIFLDYSGQVPYGFIEMQARIKFWNDRFEWPYQTEYYINDSIHKSVESYYDSGIEHFETLIPNSADSISVEIKSKDFFASKKTVIDLLPKTYFRNFKKQDIGFTRYNRVILKYTVLGNNPLPGVTFKRMAPSKIKYKNRNYFFKMID